MKRTVLALLLALLCLGVCAGCSAQTQDETAAPDDTAAPVDVTPQVEETPLSADTLRVEIASRGELDALIAMEEDFAALLKDALAAQDCTVGSLQLSFGASADATAQALAEGSVDVAWLDATAYAGANGLQAVLAAEGEEGSVCCLCTADTAAARALAQKSATWDDLREAAWAIQDEQSLLGYWLPSLYLADKYDGHDITELSAAQVCDGFDAARGAQADIVALPAAEAAGRTVLARIDGGYTGAVAVAEGSDWDDANFTAKLCRAVCAMMDTDEGRALLEGYGHYGYRAASDGDFDALRRLAAMGYGE